MCNGHILYPTKIGHVVDVALLVDIVGGNPERVREFHRTTEIAGVRS